MQFVMKHFSKKVLSVILALMILISAVSVAFSAIVTAQSAPYLVTEGKPAIPAMQGSLIDLSKIEVQFGDNIYSGAALEWAAVDTMGGSVSNTAKTILYATSKPFAVTATHTESGKSKTIYVLQPDTTTGEVVLYDHIFTTDDLTTGSDGYKVFKESSEWTYWSNATTDKLRFDIYSYNGGLCTLNDIAGQQVIYYLKPDSDAGRLVSNFPDLTIETVSASRGLEGTSGPFFRLNIGNDGLTTPRDESFVFAGIIRRSSTTSNPVVQVYTENGQINDNNSYPYYYQGGTAVRLYIAAKAYPVELFLTTRATIEGKNLTINYKTSSDKACTTNVIEALPVRINLSSKELSTTGGTIGAGAYGYQPDSRNIGLHSFKALITFSASELAKMDDFSTTEGIVIVSAGKPAVAMLSGKTLDLNKIVVTYNDGSVVTGNEINWSINDKAVILDSNNALTVYKAGTYELIATKKSDGNAKKTIYIFAVDSKKYAINLYEYTFKQSDKGTVGTDGTYSFGSSAEEKPWKIYAAAGTSVVWDAGGDPDGLGSASGITSRVNLGLNTGTATSTLMLNPNSAEGKLVSNFADYTIVYRSTTHPNFVSWNSVSASVAARYVMTGTTPVRANDRYLGTTFYWSNAL